MFDFIAGKANMKKQVLQDAESQAKRKEDRKRGYNRKNGTCVTG